VRGAGSPGFAPRRGPAGNLRISFSTTRSGPRGGSDRRESREIGILAIAGLAEQDREPAFAAKVLSEIDEARERGRIVREVHDQVEARRVRSA
jgi:hypothetical protein